MNVHTHQRRDIYVLESIRGRPARSLRGQGHRPAGRQDRGAHHGGREPRELRADARALRARGGDPTGKGGGLPFARFGEKVDTVLGRDEIDRRGPGLDRSFEIAFVKSQLGGGARLPRQGTVFVSVRDEDKERVLEAIRTLTELGFKVIATSGTQRF